MTLAIVTGAARGIGRAIAERLAADGHELLLIDVNEDVKRTAADLGATAVRADITDAADVREIVLAVERSGHQATVLVNNAGITRDSLIRKMETADFRLVLKVNLGGTIALTEAVAPLLADGGAIVNISSRAQLGNVGQFNYVVSKGGVLGATRALALAYAPRLRVNAVAPGFVESEMTQAMPDKVRDRIVAQVPLARAGQPADIASTVSWVASADAAYITGQVVYACGGRSFGSRIEAL